MSFEVEMLLGKKRSSLHVKKAGQIITIVDVLDRDDAMKIAERLIDDTSAAIRDRCYSLVQSIARLDASSAIAGVDNLMSEASDICRDAGWK